MWFQAYPIMWQSIDHPWEKSKARPDPQDLFHEQERPEPLKIRSINDFHMWHKQSAG